MKLVMIGDRCTSDCAPLHRLNVRPAPADGDMAKAVMTMRILAGHYKEDEKEKAAQKPGQPTYVVESLSEVMSLLMKKKIWDEMGFFEEVALLNALPGQKPPEGRKSSEERKSTDPERLCEEEKSAEENVRQYVMARMIEEKKPVVMAALELIENEYRLADGASRHDLQKMLNKIAKDNASENPDLSKAASDALDEFIACDKDEV